MSTGKNSKNYIVTVDQEKIEPDLAEGTVINFDPLNRAGKEGGFYLTDEGELHIDNEDVMEAHKMAINKYPYDDAIKMIQLPFEEGEKVHQFSENSFRLYGLPAPQKGHVVGVIGRNGIGKSLSFGILSGDVKPNLGRYGEDIDWDDILERYRGTDLQTQFKKLSREEVGASVKPQQVEQIPEKYSGDVREFLEDSGSDTERLIEALDLENLMDRNLDELSGGELQRVAIASTLLEEADLYMFDEPSSFLDVKQRLKAGREIRRLGEERLTMVIDHDLATLDLVSDNVNIFFGEAGSYGMVSDSFSAREGINSYLEGYLPNENIRFRPEEISFDRTKRSSVENNTEVLSFEAMEKSFGEDGFSLETPEGSIHEEEILGVFGENGLGKTVFAKMLAGAIEPEEGEAPDASISYKPQYLEAQDASVKEALSAHANPDSKRFENRIGEPLDLEELFEQNLQELSGGELQRVGIAVTLSRDADLYLLDEPSAFLDVESRVSLAKTLKRYSRKTEKPMMVIDHDLMMMDYISDRGIVFTGEPGEKGLATEILRIDEAMNRFLKEVDLTYRKDPETNRPRANKPGSQKDQEQRAKDEYYEQ